MANPINNDFYSTVLKDLEDFGMENLQHDSITKMKKASLKKLVKMKCREAALNYLLSEKKTKMANLNYSKLELQEYLKNENIYISQRKFLFRLRTNMLKFAFNMGNKTMQCPLCYMNRDDQNHLMDCIVINLYMDDDTENVKYEDIFSEDQQLIERAAKVLSDRFRKREVLLS